MGKLEIEAEAIGEEEVLGRGGVIGKVIGGVVEVRARVEKIEALEVLEAKWRGQWLLVRSASSTS